MISTMPAVIELLAGRERPQGVLWHRLTLRRLLEKIPDTDVRDLVDFLYNSAWRSGEGQEP